MISFLVVGCRASDLNLKAEMWQTHRKFKSALEKNSSHLPRSATPLGSVYGGGTTGTGAMPRPGGLDPVGVEPTARIPKGCNPLARGEPPGIAPPLANPHPNGMPLFPLAENPHFNLRSKSLISAFKLRSGASLRTSQISGRCVNFRFRFRSRFRQPATLAKTSAVCRSHPLVLIPYADKNVRAPFFLSAVRRSHTLVLIPYADRNVRAPYFIFRRKILKFSL